MWDGNKMHEWILLQTDCWIEEHVCFHISRLFYKYAEQHPEEMARLSEINKRELERVISIEAHLAKHTVMNQRHKDEKQRGDSGHESNA